MAHGALRKAKEHLPTLTEWQDIERADKMARRAAGLEGDETAKVNVSLNPARRSLAENKTQITIGLDLGDRRHTYCVLDEAGKMAREGTLGNTRFGLVRHAPQPFGAKNGLFGFIARGECGSGIPAQGVLATSYERSGDAHDVFL